MGKFVVRTAEQMVVAAVTAFGGVALAGDGNLSRGALAAAAAAALRAVYGVFVKNTGEDDQSPSVK